MNGDESGTERKKRIESNLSASDLSSATNYLFVFVKRKESVIGEVGV